MRANSNSRLSAITAWVLHRFISSVTQRNLKQGLPRLLVLPGDHVSDIIIADGLYEKRILEAMFENWLTEHLPGFAKSIALDVGAYIGNHTLYFARIFRRVLAFEPNDTAFDPRGEHSAERR
jgi:hypothetical protein